MNFFNYKNSNKKILMVTAVTIAVLFAISLPCVFAGKALAVDTLDTGLKTTADAATLPTTEGIATIVGQIIYAILGFLGVIFILLLIYGGFLRMTAQGDPGKIKTSYGIITSAVIGVVIILASYTITAFVLTKIGGSIGEGGGGGNGGGEDFSTCASVNGTCYPMGTCPSGTHSEGNKDCGYDTNGNLKACCTTY